MPALHGLLPTQDDPRILATAEQTEGNDAKKKLRATAIRDGRFWFLKSDDLENFYTQALNIAEIPVTAKGLAALLTERPESDLDVEVSIDAPELTAHLRAATALAAKAKELKAESARE